MALGKETTKGQGGWFPSIIGPNDKGPRTNGYPHNGGMPGTTPSTPSYDAKKIPVWPEMPGVEAGGAYAET